MSYVLTLGTQVAWWGLVPVFKARLTAQERAALAFMSLKSMDRDDAVMTAEAALYAGAGQPQAPIFSFMDQANSWAAWAEPEEREAYCLAAFNRMAPARQAAFLEFVQRRACA
ncbi:hypothetical protein [Roseovarius sp.]|uniref:hypothetical protein n=1 Tax=Roseovarius sp. TaxID=1486281 RepID=UPI003BA9E9A7